MHPKIKLFFSNYWILLILVAVKFILQYAVVNPVYDLHRDEYLHLNQANHLAWGFISVPPLTSWISKIIFLLGGEVFWVRFFPALFGALTIVFAWLLVGTLNGKLFAKLLVGLGLLFSVLMRLNILFQPNAFDILAWTMVLYFLVKYLKTEKSYHLLFCAIAIVAGIYNKYNLVFLLVGLGAALLILPQRKIFFTKTFWLSISLVILLLLPNLIWQITHHFPVIQHMRVLKESQLNNNSITGFFTSQLMFFLGSLPLSIAALIAFIRYKPFMNYRFVGLSFAITLVLFALLKAKDYYAAGLYPALLAFGGVYLENVLLKGWKRYFRPVLIAFNLALFIIVFNYLFPVLKPESIIERRTEFEKLGLLRWEDGKNHHLPQDFADMLGWKEMAQKTLEAYSAIPESERNQTLIFCDNYGQTGALNYYNRNKMPEAYSFNTDYIFWLPKFDKIKNVLLVGDKPDTDILALFLECKLMGTITDPNAREKGTQIYLLSGAKEKFTPLFYEITKKRIDDFDIF